MICGKHDVMYLDGQTCWCCDLEKTKADSERIKGPDDTLAELTGREALIAKDAGQTPNNPTVTTGGSLTPRTSWPAWMTGEKKS